MDNPIVSLVNLFAAYEQQHQGASIEDFCRHYLAVRNLASEAHPSTSELPKNVLLSITLGRLARFADMYTKKALERLPVSNTEEIVYLMILQGLGTPRKSELIQHGLSEFSTGVEIIRRLKKANLVEEFPDLEDRRSKRICLTAQGTHLLTEVYPKMGMVANIVAGSLLEEEKDLLLQILGRLDKRHQEVYSRVKPKSLEETAEVFDLRETP